MLQPLGAALRRLYDSGWLVRDKLCLPSLCVGNVGFGGAGKTPVAQYLASRLLARRFFPAVVMRVRFSPRPRISRPMQGSFPPYAVRAAAQGYGDDEEWECAVRLPGAVVAVGRDRPAALSGALHAYEQRARRQRAPGAAILDDGFQHAGLATDLCLLVVNGGSGGLAGRETLRSAASRADLVVLHRRATFEEGVRTGDAGDRLASGSFARVPGPIPLPRSTP